MDDKLKQSLAEMQAEREIRNIIQRYMRAADRKDFALMASVYHDDAIEDHGPLQGSPHDLIAWVRKRHETIQQAMHIIGNCLIDFDGPDRAYAETYCIIIQHERTGTKQLASGEPALMRTMMGVRYVDRFEKRADAWKIARRILVTEWIDEKTGQIDFGPAWTKAERSTDDAIYRIRSL